MQPRGHSQITRVSLSCSFLTWWCNARVSGLINGSKGSVRMYGNLTQLNKLNSWGRKKTPGSKKCLYKEPYELPLPLPQPALLKHPISLLLWLTQVGWILVGMYQAYWKAHWSIAFAEPNVLSDESSEYFGACALCLSARGRMIHHEPCSSPGGWGYYRTSTQWFQVSPKYCFPGMKIYAKSSGWELGLPKQEGAGRAR